MSVRVRIERLLEAIQYRGETFSKFNTPKPVTDGSRYKKVVLAKQGKKIKLIRFGHRGYQHNYSEKAKENYLRRSAGIRDKAGRLTKDNKLSANYWARKILWPRTK